MKTLAFLKAGSRYFYILLILCGVSLSSVFAQDNNPPQDKKKKEKSMHIKVITKDDKGKITKFDTIYTKGDKPGDTIIRKHLKHTLDMKELEDKLKEMEVTLNFDMDSLDSLSKEITAEVFMDDHFPGNCKVFKYGFNDDDNDPELLPDGDAGDWNQGMNCCPKVHMYPPQPNQQSWMQGYTPWGKIRDIKVKNKRHGKKIVIRTEDTDMYDFMYMAPPPPPAPPIPPNPPKVHKGMKKIIIEKDKDDK